MDVCPIAALKAELIFSKALDLSSLYNKLS